jgi:hypothetical protein
VNIMTHPAPPPLLGVEDDSSDVLPEGVPGTVDNKALPPENWDDYNSVPFVNQSEPPFRFPLLGKLSKSRHKKVSRQDRVCYC